MDTHLKRTAAIPEIQKVLDLIALLLNQGVKVSLWDPYIEKKDIEFLRSLNVEVYEETPEYVQLAFLYAYITIK